MQLLYLPWWFFKNRFLGQRKPLQTVLFISNKCNLRCKHCNVVQDEKTITKPIEQIKEELNYSYRLGARFVDFEGGEPCIWQDREYKLNDLILLAKEIGFFSTTITTNAQLPFHDTLADSIWVSMDGLYHYHDQIRGEGAFEKLEKHIAMVNHSDLNVNMVINNLNYENVTLAVQYVKQHPGIKSISLNFHTPYPGSESLSLPWEKRIAVIDEIIALKKQHYPIMNSVSGLKLMKKHHFKRYCWISNFILPDGTRLPECPGKTQGICDQCGLCMAGEMTSVFHFKLDTIWAGMRLRM